MKKIIIVLVIIMLLGLLGGCCCCPTCPSQEWSPTIVGEKPYCCDYDYGNDNCSGDYFLNDMRKVAPWAYPRSCAQEQPQFASLADTQRVIDDIYGSEDIVSAFKQYPGCARIPFGTAHYKNGSALFMLATMDSQHQVKFYMVVGNQLFLVPSDKNITSIEFS